MLVIMYDLFFFSFLTDTFHKFSFYKFYVFNSLLRVESIKTKTLKGFLSTVVLFVHKDER